MLEISVTKLHIFSFSTKETEQFPDPKHHRSATYYNKPISQADGHNVEELTSEFDNSDLSDKDEQCYRNKLRASMKMQSRPSRCECLGIEKIPELEKNKYGKEQ